MDLTPYDERAALGLLDRKTSDDLILYNYTPQCQYSRSWDEYTTSARGLIVTTDGEVVARPFPKFFNLGETGCPPIPDLPYRAFEKIDGSLGIWYHHRDKWRVATRGSFENDFTAYASQFSCLMRHYPPEWTILTEICMPRELDKMVRAIPHAPGLYLLGAVNRNSAEDIDPLRLESIWNGYLVSSCEKSVDKLLEESSRAESTEGWVIRFGNGQRVKIKTAWYLRLFRAISNLTEKHIKELMVAGGEWLVEIPEEIRPEAERIHATICERYAIRFSAIHDVFNQYNHPDRKTFALAVKDHPDKAYLFLLYDNRDIRAKLILDC